MPPIYLDNNATTPVDPQVFEAMKPYFTQKFGNASSTTHHFGWDAAEAVELARESIVKGLGATSFKSLIFTSGATEANNLAILGVAKASRLKIAHFITQKTEHKCVLEACRQLEDEGH